MTDKQINLVKNLDKTVFFDGDTVQFNFIEFDKPIKGVCFNKSVYIPIEELEYILQQFFDKEKGCEELKEQLTILDDEDVVVEITVKQFEEYKKLKQTLAEIKSLCYQQDLNEDFFACEVLQKISEVVNEQTNS